MPFITYEQFIGKDLRRLNARSDPASSRVATNLDLTTGGGYRTRDGIVKVCDVSDQSVGLYSVGGFLRTVVPGGQSIQDSQPPFVIYDPIGDGNAYPLDTISKLLSAQIIGASALTGVFPYLAIQRFDGGIEHHWIKEAPFVASVAVNSKIILPYTPGTSLLKFGQRLWAADQVNGVVRFSSIINGPSDWTLEKDAGNLPVLQYTAGNRQITGLGFYNNLLAVLFDSTIQLYDVPANPALHAQKKVLYGPGTHAPNSVQNVLGDLFYFSRGGFRSLSVANQVGEFREGDIGSAIQDETDDIADSASVTGVALWSQARSQYVCAFGQIVHVFTYSNQGKVKGWTKWELPLAIESMVELDGVLYFRANNAIYKFDPTVDTDNGVDFDWMLETQYVDARVPGREKMFETLQLVQSGKSHLTYLTDPRRSTAFVNGPTVSGSTGSLDGIGVDVVSRELALRFSGTKRWQLDSYSLKYHTLQGL